MKSRLLPTLRYQDPNAAVKWLCTILGFEKHMVHPDDGSRIIHAQLSLGDDMIMLGGTRDDEFGKHSVLASEVNNKNTQSPYIIVADVKKCYDHCKENGVEIALEFRKEEYGGESFSCKDLEGNLWNIGSYNPWPE